MDPVVTLRTHFGCPSFRPGQEELVRAVLAGRDGAAHVNVEARMTEACREGVRRSLERTEGG